MKFIAWLLLTCFFRIVTCLFAEEPCDRPWALIDSRTQPEESIDKKLEELRNPPIGPPELAIQKLEEATIAGDVDGVLDLGDYTYSRQPYKRKLFYNISQISEIKFEAWYPTETIVDISHNYTTAQYVVIYKINNARRAGCILWIYRGDGSKQWKFLNYPFTENDTYFNIISDGLDSYLEKHESLAP